MTTAPGEGPSSVDEPRIEAAVREILLAIGEDPDRDGLVGTPARVARMYGEILSGVRQSGDQHLTATFDAGHDEMVMVKDIPLYSLCVLSSQLVDAVGGTRRAREVEVGDRLWTLDDDGRLAPTEVVSAAWRRTDELVAFRAGRSTVRLTPNHPVMTPAGWVDAGELHVGQKVQWTNPRRSDDGEWVEVEAVERVRQRGTRPFRVHSFHCEPHHSFLTGGVLVKNCEHHLIPFVGKAHVAYIPGEDGRITGLSKLARLVQALAKRPQLQERLTVQIADEIEDSLAPRGVLVVIQAEHLCMSMRGVRTPGTTTVTSAVRGQFRESAATRDEAMRFLSRDGG